MHRGEVSTRDLRTELAGYFVELLDLVLDVWDKALSENVEPDVLASVAIYAALVDMIDRYGPGPDQLDNLVYSLRVKLRGMRMGLRGVVAEGHDIVIRVDPKRLLDVDELNRRMAGRLSIGVNRIKMRRQGDGWQKDLLTLLEEMTDLYRSANLAVTESRSG